MPKKEGKEAIQLATSEPSSVAHQFHNKRTITQVPTCAASPVSISMSSSPPENRYRKIDARISAALGQSDGAQFPKGIFLVMRARFMLALLPLILGFQLLLQAFVMDIQETPK